MNIIKKNPMFNRPLVNVGACFDIPTGQYVKGPNGDMILNGGISNVEGIVGRGNNFKSTISHYFMLQGVNRMNASGIKNNMHTYDTEDNMGLNLDRINNLAKDFDYIIDEPLYDPNEWSLVSKSEMTAEEWAKELYNLAKEKSKDDKNKVPFTAFVNKLTNENLRERPYNFIEIDSFSELEASNTIETVEKDIQNSNTVFMQQGLFKSKLLKDFPRLSNRANLFFILTAHIGEKINMASGPYAPQPKKSLSYLKQDDKIKGVSDKLYFLTTHLWYVHGTTVLMNRDTKQPEYPKDGNDNDTDLNIVRVLPLRSKSGPSGYTLELIVSQREGVLPTLTEFHNIKTNKFGLDGNLRNYNLFLLPDVKLSRTTIRSKIDSNRRLQRAINITSELLQISKFMHQYRDLICTPEELYNDIKALGYDWDQILDSRGWWTIDNYNGTLAPYVSTLDLLLLRKEGKGSKQLEKMKVGK